MDKRIISIIYKLLTLFCLCFGVFLNLMLTRSIPSLLSYYTLQSNILCIIGFGSYIILDFKKDNERSDVYYLVKGAILVSILTTSVVYHISLGPYGFNMVLNRNICTEIANLFVHTISPILVFLDYLFFDIKGNFKLYYPFLWLIIPANYVIYVYTYSSIGGRFYTIGGSKKFGYIFLDYQKIGVLGVGKSLIIIMILILLLSYLIFILDKIMKKRCEI